MARARLVIPGAIVVSCGAIQVIVLRAPTASRDYRTKPRRVRGRDWLDLRHR